MLLQHTVAIAGKLMLGAVFAVYKILTTTFQLYQIKKGRKITLEMKEDIRSQRKGKH